MNKMRFLSILMMAVMAVALAACGGDSGGGGTASMSNSDLLKKAAENMKNAKSYSISVDGTSAGSPIKMTGDLDIANKNSKLDVNAAGQNVGIVIISDTTYLSTDGGQNFMDAGASGASITQGFSSFTTMWNNFNSADADKSKDALKDGTPVNETINGVNCKHMTAAAKDLGSLSATGGTTIDGNVDIWAANDGSQVCQLKVKGTSSGSTADITMTWSNLNKSFDIKAPATTAPLALI